MKKRALLAAALSFGLAATASAQWSDGFESYAPGTVLDNVGGWAGWDNNPAAAGTVDNARAHSGSNSVRIGSTGDAVHPWSGYTSGVWTLSMYQYIESNSQGDIYVILNNQYNHGGPYQWSLQLRANAGAIGDVDRGGSVPLALDQWSQIRIEIDLDNNTLTSFYNNTMVSTGVYNVLGGGLEIANIDLFNAGSGTAWYDDVDLSGVPAPGALALLGFAGLASRRRRRN